MTDIDNMDIFRYFEVIAYGSKEKEVQTGFIDDMM